MDYFRSSVPCCGNCAYFLSHLDACAFRLFSDVVRAGVSRLQSPCSYYLDFYSSPTAVDVHILLERLVQRLRERGYL